MKTNIKNILYSIGGMDENKLNPNMISDMNIALGVEKSYVILDSILYQTEFEKESLCILHEDLVYAKFEQYEFLVNNILPIDDDILRQIESELLEIIKIQQRYEGHGKTRTVGTLDFHYNKMMKTLLVFNSFLDNVNIQQVVFTNVPHQGYDNLIYHLCKLKGIKICILFISTIPGRKRVLSDYSQLENELDVEFQKLKKDYQAETIENIQLEDINYFEDMLKTQQGFRIESYIIGSSFQKIFENVYGKRNIFNYLLQEIYSKTYGYNNRLIKIIISIINLPCFLMNILKKAPKIIFIKKVYRDSVNLHKKYNKMAYYPKEENYIYYAMHYMPELTSAPLGGGLYMDQTIPIRILANALPENWKVYVKIHPVQFTNNCSITLLQEISKISNVKLIKEYVSSCELLKNAQAVATLTGSVAQEAQFLNIPVIIFGFSEKNVAPLSYKVRTVKECREAIENILKNPKKTDKKELKIYIKAMENISFVNNKQEVVNQIVNFCLNQETK